MPEQNTRLGIWLMICATIIFTIQDAISRHLGQNYNVYMVVMIRFWAFAAFAVFLAARSPGGLRAAAKTHFPILQTLRGLLLIGDVCLMVIAFVHLGLIETHAVFICYPLLIAALSGPILGEKVGWRRWSAIGVGFVGVLIILQPGAGVFSLWALFALAAALMFAVYGLLNRYVARADSATVSFFWTGVVGAIAMTPLGLMHWQWMAPTDWLMMGTLCMTGMFAHFLFIKVYEVAEASAVQPFAYLQLVWASILGIVLFDETLRTNVAIGAVLVVAAGLFTLWRAKVRARQT